MNAILINVNQINEKLQVIDKVSKPKAYRTLVDALERNIKLLVQGIAPMAEVSLLGLKECTWLLECLLKPVELEYQLVHVVMKDMIETEQFATYHDLTVSFEKLHRIKSYLEDYKSSITRVISSRKNIQKQNKEDIDNKVKCNVVVSKTKEEALHLLVESKILIGSVSMNMDRSQVTTSENNYRLHGGSSFSMYRGMKGDTLFIDKRLELDFYYNEIKPITSGFKNVEFLDVKER